MVKEYERVIMDDLGDVIYVSVEDVKGVEVTHAIRFSPQPSGNVLIDVGGFVTTDTILEFIRDGKYATKGSTRNQTMAHFLVNEGMEEMCDGHTYNFYDLHPVDALMLMGKLAVFHGFDF